MEVDAHGVGREPGQRGDLGTGQALDEPQHQRFPIGVRQPANLRERSGRVEPDFRRGDMSGRIRP